MTSNRTLVTTTLELQAEGRWIVLNRFPPSRGPVEDLRAACGLATALSAVLQMQLYEIGRLSETQPALARGRFAPFQFRGNCIVPTFGISIAADFKFLHLDARHHGTPSQQETHWHVETTMPLFRSILSPRANHRIGGNWEGVTKREPLITRMGHPSFS